AERAPGGWRLYGHRWYVLAAHAADVVVVPAVTDSGPAMFLVDPRSLGCTVSGQLGLDLTRRVSVTAFDEAPALLIVEGEVATANPEAPKAAHVAALRAGEAFRAVTESAVHLFGGNGLNWEHDVHLYYRRAWSAERLAGGPQAHRAAISDADDS